MLALLTIMLTHPLLPVRVDRKWGLIDRQGQMVIQPQYHMIHALDGPTHRYRVGGKWGLLGRDGRVVLPARFLDLYTPAEGKVSFREPHPRGRGRKGFVDLESQKIIEPVYDYAYEFSGGLALVGEKRGGQLRFGYIDPTGQIRIPLQFSDASNFEQGRARVCTASPARCRFIDTRGKALRWRADPPNTGCRNGLVTTRNTAFRYGLATCEGKRLFRPKFVELGALTEFVSFDGRPEPARLLGRWGYIDRRGKWILRPQYRRAGAFHEDRALVQLEDKTWGLINQKGERAPAPADLSGTGKMVDGRMIAGCARRKKGVIDAAGAWVVPCKYTWIRRTGAVFQVIQGGEKALQMGLDGPKIGYVDRDGTWIWPLQG